jgi:hypothetical protein
MLIGRTGRDDRSQVIVLGDLDQRMVCAAGQNLAIDQGGEPREDWREKTADQVLDAGWNVG